MSVGVGAPGSAFQGGQVDCLSVWASPCRLCPCLPMPTHACLPCRAAPAALSIYYGEASPSPSSVSPDNACSPDALDRHHGVEVVWFFLAWFLVTLSLQLCCPLEYQPPGWHVPWWLMPWLPTVAIGLVVFR